MSISDVLPSTWQVADGRARVGDVDLQDLAVEMGTPVYVVDEAHVRDRMAAFRRAFGPEVVLAFAAKSFFCWAMARLVAEHGWWADVVSLGEATTALSGGVPPDHLLLHGNYKTTEELALAVEPGVGRVVIDHPSEIPQLAELVSPSGTEVEVLLRLNVDVGARTHPKILTSGAEVHFGMELEAATAALGLLEAAGGQLRLQGIHTHIGSQITDPETYRLVVEPIADFVAEHRAAFPEPVELNLGGGMAVPYLRHDPVLHPADYAAAITPAVAQATARIGPVRLMLEPGRAVVANAGLTLYRIGVRKDVAAGAPFLAVDGGISDNIRPALYGAQYEVVLPARMDDAHESPFRVVGRHCEPSDVLASDARLPADAGPGELLAVPVTGAYSFVMASRYNLVPRPAVVMVAGGEARMVVPREEGLP